MEVAAMATYFTEHARARMQQRGISAAAIDMLLSYGRTSHDHHGGEIVFFDKAARERLAKQDPAAARLARTYAVLGSDGMVVTVGHRYRRIRH
ncbi:MAG: hypothetical protein A3G81_12535 [Betaproteobacteria bacterium RIFCSPLOWO2_12_FULL_65_14]|nr:MAG: hypothetical protein A3G81_12535 [Betaproteobacteria bacterium RIFCSPLOWO2_12_FULL_65_14]